MLAWFHKKLLWKVYISKTCSLKSQRIGVFVHCSHCLRATLWGMNSLRFLLCVCIWATQFPAVSKKDTGQNAERHLFAWGLTLRWIYEHRKCPLQLCWNRCTGLRGCDKELEASPAHNILRLPFLTLNKSISIQFSKRKK